MKAIITVGLGFGDEGKGATVDFLCRNHAADLVVRYCGGAQAGHNVELPDGRRHTFSQFGAGTLAGARTYLGSRMILNPATLVPEESHLIELGVDRPRQLMTVHPHCLVSSTYHVMMNRIRERARGASRHGSCGLGVGETRHYWLRHGRDAVFADDLKHRSVLIEKLTLMRDRFLLEVHESLGFDREFAEILRDTWPAMEADLLIESTEGIRQDSQMPRANLAIFEGSQGVLLDEYFGFHPYTTWSTVTAKHAIEMLAEAGVSEYLTLGLTRAYSTRHGAGPFPTRCESMSRRFSDRGNPTNAWQGSMDAGSLDLVLLRFAASVVSVDGLVVNHLDEFAQQRSICRRYQGRTELSIPRSIEEQTRMAKQLDKAEPVIERVSERELLSELSTIAPIAIKGYGPTYQSRSVVPNGLALPSLVGSVL